jgi:hypothetical protein
MALRDLGALDGEQERLAGRFFDNLVQMPEGKGVVTVRLLSDENKPLTEGGLFMVSRIHFVNGKSLHCPKELVDGEKGKFWKGACPICEYYNKLWQDSKKQGLDADEVEALETKARSIKPIERYYYNCVVRSQTNKETGEVEHNVGPKILPIGKTIHQQIIRGIRGSKDDPSDKGYGDVTDYKSGRDFRIVKTIKGTGKQAYPEYSQSKFLDVGPAGTPDEITEWEKALHDLNTLRVLKPYDELLHQLRVHFGVEKDDSVGFDMTALDAGKPTDNKAATAASKVEVTETETPDVTVTTDGSETLADDEFLKELQSM